ncbi:hypothetical protein DFH08DRAFT_800191 [Mycena albidolilacea]|uniref:RPN1 N-terminal domain-containing protein n=1 Tax=Mycena albidolilacea TaxID=1033008 RepID=A0AAD7AKM0_9AGAR|nr:hypothetical protein DFH08DRAFT_800191 [Mycena albidolilacea]
MTYSDTQPRGALCLHLSGQPGPHLLLGGHKYIRHLAAELGNEYTFQAGKNEAPAKVELIGAIEDLRALAKECTVFLVGHNAEPDTVGLLKRLEILDEIAWLVDDNTYNLL